MKKTAYLLVALLALSVAPALAQGPFTDVPADHWAYDAIDMLQKDGVMIGYPDGTFQGKRTITRYEFATAIARVVAMIPTEGGKPVDLSNYVTKDELKTALGGIEKIDMTKFATKADVDALRKLIDEFRDEIAALGVDVDALKRDVAALGARVDAIEAELKRVKITGDATVFAIGTSANRGVVIDLDQRTASAAQNNNTLLKAIGLVKDFDLKVAGRVSNCVTANATINYGNYLNYLGFVDDYVGGARPTNTTPVLAGINPNNPNADSLSDAFFPYYLSIDAALGKGSVTVGRFPLQFTPYTLKMIDVDSYTNILKTDDGNYPVDGAKVAWNFGGVDLSLYAAKHDSNNYLGNGLTGQPFEPGFVGTPNGVLHQDATGNAVGGLMAVTQSAGFRATAGIPFQGTLGLTFYQAWDKNAYTSVLPGGQIFDQARVYGVDLAIPIPWVENVAFAGSWTRSDTILSTPAENAGVTNADVDYKNVAWDAKLTGTVSALAIGAGYKNIGRNFAAAGAWDKIGRWTNPVDVKGPYAEFAYPILDNLKVSLNGEYLTLTDEILPAGSAAWGSTTSDSLVKAETAIRWGFTKCNALDVAYQWVKFNPDMAGVTSATENYLTLGLSHQMSPNAGIKVGYQLISYTNSGTGVAGGPYGLDYRGGLGVVQFGVSF